MSENPLLLDVVHPKFGEIKPEHVVPAVRAVLAELEGRVATLEVDAQPTWAGLVVPLDEIEQRLERVWDPVGHLMRVDNSDEIRAAHSEVQPEVVQFGLRMGQSEPIYKALKALKDGAEWATLDSAQQRIVDKMILDAESAGIGLQGEQRARFNEIASRLSTLSTEFSNTVLDATNEFGLEVTDKADLDGLPHSALQMYADSANQYAAKHGKEATATPENGPWRIGLSIPSFLAFMKEGTNREIREKLYRAFITRASEFGPKYGTGEHDNAPRIKEILTLRTEKAKLLGYENYAAFSLANKMAGSVQDVDALLEKLRAASWEPGKQEHEELVALAQAAGQTEPFMHWDAAYYSERLKEQKFGFTQEELRPYFPMDTVLDGLFGLVQRLFGARVERADGDVPVWNDDVRFYKIFDVESGAHIASFYLDAYSRPHNKSGGAWMDVCARRWAMPDSVQVPVAYLICNQTPPSGDTPSLMTFNEVTTLFHEFGHGLHHMLTRVDYPRAAGVAGVEWDAIELPSQFMENWCYHKPTLLGMTKHYKTGEPLPEDLFDKLSAARTFRTASMQLRQLTFGMTDMELHARFDPAGSGTVFDVHRQISEKTSVIPPLDEDRFLCSFAHIFAGGYAAGYYSYKWAEVMSADAFAAFEEAGLDNEGAVQEVGRKYRDTVLALGGSQHPTDVYKAFRGRDPEPEALLRHQGLVGSN